MNIEHESEPTPQEQIREIVRRYQHDEFLPVEYPTYGVDRFLLENYETIEGGDYNVPAEQRMSLELKQEIRNLFQARTNDFQSRGDYSRNTWDDKRRALRQIWQENYLLPRTDAITVEDEVNYWASAAIAKGESLVEGEDFCIGGSALENGRVVLYDTYLVPGMCGAAARHLIVPPHVELTGELGHCTVSDYADLGQPKQNHVTALKSGMSLAAVEHLSTYGYIERTSRNLEEYLSSIS